MPSGEMPPRDRIRCRTVRSPQSGLVGNNREIRAIVAYFGGRTADFLCNPDCVAEREGFEPSVQVFSPYNGLANESFSPPSLVVKQLTVGAEASRSGSEAIIRQLLCSALCSKFQIQVLQDLPLKSVLNPSRHPLTPAIFHNPAIMEGESGCRASRGEGRHL